MLASRSASALSASALSASASSASPLFVRAAVIARHVPPHHCDLGMTFRQQSRGAFITGAWLSMLPTSISADIPSIPDASRNCSMRVAVRVTMRGALPVCV
jgi:hypothetical protein